MKVMHVIPSLAARTGGPPVAVVESCLALNRIGVETAIFATDMAEAAGARSHAKLEPSDLPEGAESLDLHLFPVKAPSRFGYSPALDRAIAAAVRDFDAVHIHSLFLYPQIAASRRARNARVPYIVAPRGSLDADLRSRSRAAKAMVTMLWQRNLLAGAAAIHVTSEAEQRAVADVAPGVWREVVPNGVRWARSRTSPNTDAFRRRCLRREDGPVVLYHGRINHKKGLDVLLRAFAIVRHARPDAQLVIAGPDDEGLMPRLQQVASGLALRDVVSFTGMLRGDEKRAALASAAVWALPSQTENFGNAVVEAMAARLPVVVSPGVALSAEIASSDAGIVAERTPEAFAAAITALLNDDARRTALGAAARKYARRYDWENVAPMMVAMYERATHRRARAA